MSFEPETSIALGFGFRCGFLGLLHMDIIQERLEREFNLDIITTAPSVIYKITKTDGTLIELTNPTNMPSPSEIRLMEEPIVKSSIITPSDYVGAVMDLAQNRRGIFKDMQYLDTTRVSLNYEIPLNEIIYDFFDALKSRTRGYASFDYELIGYKDADLVKLDILLNADIVDALSMIVPRERAYAKGRNMAQKLKEIIPRQMFEIPIQAAVGAKIIARETIKAMRKDVLAKCYGGDISRKRKTFRKTKRRKEKNETSGICRSTTGSIYGSIKNRGIIIYNLGVLVLDREDKNKEVSLYIHIPFCMQNVYTVILHLIVKRRSNDGLY